MYFLHQDLTAREEKKRAEKAKEAIEMKMAKQKQAAAVAFSGDLDVGAHRQIVEEVKLTTEISTQLEKQQEEQV